ncbi:interferon gamma receptor 2 isoform X1 [Gymnogyps californianus]|uniref:interferon gamma receptor 2 isoform X1 n=2 Tax=Gymnogyps californianus TaxID=33616 RepID=UPI0021C906EC|nr:interferon gamma receptor 2 isoform X1 [Gymnogyps californianus]
MPCRAPLPSLLLLLLLGSVRASGAESSPHLPAPKDVMVYSYNFHSSLRWSPVKVDRGLVLYTVHFKTGAFNQWDEMNCTRITQTECSFPMSLKERRWTVVLRVRAELGQVTSDWVETDPFVAERNTTIGPPKVNSVIESSDSLLISVTPPFGSEAGDVLQYHVSYWENATSTTKKETKTSNTLFEIRNLKELTLYCFRIQVELMIHSDLKLLGLQSVPECYRTKISEATRAGYIVVIFVFMLLFVNLVTVGLILLWRHHKTIKYWSQPPLEIPSHFEEYLKDPSMPVLEVLDNCVEDDPLSSSVLFCGEGSQACGSSLDGQAHSHSISSESEVT